MKKVNDKNADRQLHPPQVVFFKNNFAKLNYIKINRAPLLINIWKTSFFVVSNVVIKIYLFVWLGGAKYVA